MSKCWKILQIILSIIKMRHFSEHTLLLAKELFSNVTQTKEESETFHSTCTIIYYDSLRYAHVCFRGRASL